MSAIASHPVAEAYDLFWDLDSRCLRNRLMKAEQLDRIFDEGEEDILEYLDMSTLRRPGLEPKHVNIDPSAWMVEALDREAKRVGMSRQAIVNKWIADRLEATDAV